MDADGVDRECTVDTQIYMCHLVPTYVSALPPERMEKYYGSVG